MPGQDDDGAPAAASPIDFAPAPVSTRPISADVLVRTYKESWVGNDSDILLPHRVHAFADIDMTAWAGACLDTMDALFAPEMAAAIATLDPARAASLAGHKRQLADAIAQTLIPVLVTPGQVPAVEPARALFHQSLLEHLGTAYASTGGDGGPLRRCPPLPGITQVRAVTAPSPRSIADALLWDRVVTIDTPQAAQDELLLSITLGHRSVRSTGPAAAAAVAALAPRPAATDLFEALARMVFEQPQIAPHLAAALADGNAIVARAALRRWDALIADVAQTWPAWCQRMPPATAADAEATPVAGQVIWNYAIDFGRLPALRVTRFPRDQGVLPPWPAIAGFVAPGEEGQTTGSYQAMAGTPMGAPLTVAWAGLPLLWAPEADVAAGVRRNANLVPAGAPDGTLVDPAFIYRTPAVQGPASAGPFAELPSQLFAIGTDAANLSQAIDDVLTPLLAGPTLAGLATHDLEIEIDASYRVPLGTEAMAIDSELPIFRAQNTLALSPGVSAGAIPVAVFRRGVIDALVAWHAAMRPGDERAVIRFAVTLSAPIAESLSPLLHLGRIETIVPAAKADWWQ